MVNDTHKYKLLLVGNPNVGKSMLFHKLTGEYANVSNYPGTTVDILSGELKIGGHHNIEVIDTPGFYNIVTVTEEERVSKMILLTSKADIVLHVIDAKNIARMLPLTLQLIEAGLPVILVMNMYDELVRAGLSIQASHLEHDLGIPVVVTTAVTGEGVENLKTRILATAEKRYNLQGKAVDYPEDIEGYIEKISALLLNDYILSKRAISLMLLQGDADAFNIVANEKDDFKIKEIIEGLNTSKERIKIGASRFKTTEDYLEDTFIIPTESNQDKARTFIDKFTMNPYSSIIGVALILYVGFYLFVGKFGAGFLVDLVEGDLFEGIINPHVNSFFNFLLGDSIFFNLFAGDYGVITLGLRYALAIVLPIVFTFFLMFSLLEDSGYLPRLSMTLNNLLKHIGLSGRSLIPLILGLGCGTMATVVTRTLESSRERLIVIFLLALAIPCAAQMGVILGVLGGSGLALTIWFTTILLIFALAGKIISVILKGDRPTFFMELPPLRLPKLRNILFKTFTRMKWYAMEVIPIFMWASVIIWIGKVTGIFEHLTKVMSYPASWAGLPSELGEIFLYGFFRRDFGAAGLYDLQSMLSVRQLIVATVILTLFIPCVAQFAVMVKERGAKTSLFIVCTVIPFAFLVGVILNKVLIFGGVA